MEYRLLGKSGCVVSTLALGTMTFGDETSEKDSRAQLDRFFTHSTGHGVGLEIHEPPRLGKGQQEQLEAGMVITIEPGVYIADKGGIRIEDIVVVTPTGCTVLTPVGKELLAVC